MSSIPIALARHGGDGATEFLRRASILVVDDDEPVRSVLASSLRHVGHSVVECDSGEEALRIIDARGASFDLVICDTYLGGMNGDETARRIARAEPMLPVISMSGYPRDPGGAASSLPKRYFIAKPFRVQALSALIQEALGA